MKESKKRVRNELKRMKASFNEITRENSRKPDLNFCLKCNKEAGNNFVLDYKRNQELKGKICISCFYAS
jgi:hypothetical protein